MVINIDKEAYVSKCSSIIQGKYTHVQNLSFRHVGICPCKGVEKRKRKEKSKLYLFKPSHSRWWRQRRRMIITIKELIPPSSAEASLLINNYTRLSLLTNNHRCILFSLKIKWNLMGHSILHGWIVTIIMFLRCIVV